MKQEIDWWRVALILVLGALFVWISTCAKAGEATMTWTPPTQNCDGTPLTDLAGYRIYWGRDGYVATSSTTSYQFTKLTPGEWWFSIASYTASGKESQFVSTKKVITAADFKTVGTAVYTFVKQDDRIMVLPVGTIPTGVVCDATQSVNGKHVVPRSEVTWSGSVRPLVVVGDCG